MAFCLSEHAWTASDLDSSTKLVFISLCRRANIDSLQCWPSIGTIAADCSLSERTVGACIQKLVKSGHIACRQRGMRSSVYTIKYLPSNLAADRVLADAEDQSVFSKAMGFLGKVATAGKPASAAVLAESPANFAAQVPQNLPTEPVMESVKEIPIAPPPHAPSTPAPSTRAKTATPTARPVVVIDEVPENLLADWMLVRKSKGRKVLTASELDEIHAEAAKAGMSLVEAIKECVNSGWARFKAAWLPAKVEQAIAQQNSRTPSVPAEVLERMAAQSKHEPRDNAEPMSAEMREQIRERVAAMKAQLAQPKDPLTWAKIVIANKRAGKEVSRVALEKAMSALKIWTWEEREGVDGTLGAVPCV